MPQIRRAREDLEELYEYWEKRDQEWIDAMPESLKPVCPQMQLHPLEEWDLSPLQEPLTKQYPEQTARILALFSWYGSDTGPWSEIIMYELVVTKLLLAYSTRDLLKSLEGRELSPTQIEGAARFFAVDLYLDSRRSDDLRLLPDELAARLLAHGLTGDDKNRHFRAKQAFDRN